MKRGDKVKVSDSFYRSYGEIGKIIGKEMTPFGVCFQVKFDDGIGLYEYKSLRVIDNPEEAE